MYYKNIKSFFLRLGVGFFRLLYVLIVDSFWYVFLNVFLDKWKWVLNLLSVYEGIVIL